MIRMISSKKLKRILQEIDNLREHNAKLIEMNDKIFWSYNNRLTRPKKDHAGITRYRDGTFARIE